jgi:hypothetical protein
MTFYVIFTFDCSFFGGFSRPEYIPIYFISIFPAKDSGSPVGSAPLAGF